MSRTVRRKTQDGKTDFYCFTYKWLPIPGYTTQQLVPLKKGTPEYKKAVAQYHSDGYRGHKEPGPSWYRKMTVEKPMRQRNKLELLKFMRCFDYEPVVFDMYPLEYWT